MTSSRHSVRQVSPSEWEAIRSVFADTRPESLPVPSADGPSDTSRYVVESAGEPAGAFALTELPSLLGGARRTYVLHSRMVAARFRVTGVSDAVLQWVAAFPASHPDSEIVLLVPLDREGGHASHTRHGLVLTYGGYCAPTAAGETV